MNWVAFGGHKGLIQTLKALQFMPTINPIRRHDNLQEIKITAAIQVGDDGGSTKLLRELFGLKLKVKGVSGVVGDGTACGAELCPDRFISDWLCHRFTPADYSSRMRDICGLAMEAVAKRHGLDIASAWRSIMDRFNRFPEALLSQSAIDRIMGYDFPISSTLFPHSMKNLLFVAIMLAHRNDSARAFRIFNRFCDIFPHEVMAISHEGTHLKLQMRNGDTIGGEGQLEPLSEHFVAEHADFLRNHRKYEIVGGGLDPEVPLSPELSGAMDCAHAVSIGSGSPWGSVKQSLMATGTVDAFRRFRSRSPNAPVVLVMNLTDDPLEMRESDGVAYIREINELAGGTLTHAICNSRPIPEWVTERYAVELKKPIVIKKKHRGRALYPDGFIVEHPIADWTSKGELYTHPGRLAEAFFKTISRDYQDVMFHKVGRLA